ncbi:MAG: aminotransferase class I/II-fold pyridoxal phosphate-dependent enzyme [Pseudomonadota bacterium]
MQAPKRFSGLPEYAFPRLRALLDGHAPGGEVLHMSIGEPKHPMPAFLRDVLTENIHSFAKYPANNGTEALLTAISNWLEHRFEVALDPDKNIMALNGTREGLFNAVLANCPEQKNARPANVLMPNPFYQAYAVGAAAAGAQAHFVNAVAENHFLPDYAGLPAPILKDTALLFVCSPSNPQGAIADTTYYAELLRLAEKHDFLIFADECYSEIYQGDPPPGLLQVATREGADLNRVLVFHSLSKRSNMPGLRSGFVAGGEALIAQMKQLRAYSGAPLPEPLQAVAAAAWADEDHVVENRNLYQRKYKIAQSIFADQPDVMIPQAGFFLWLPVADGQDAALRLWTQTGLRVLPGAYLSRRVDDVDPGAAYIRVAMVADERDVRQGLTALKECLYKGAHSGL